MTEQSERSADGRAWERARYARAIGKVPERRAFKTTYGAEIAPLETPDEAYARAIERLGFPGEPPYTRGIQPTMYRGRLWTMRQYAGFGSARESNARYRYLLGAGQTGLSVAFDLPTQMGYDADDPRVTGEVGKVGVSISCLDDMVELFDGIPLDKVTTSMTINATASILLALYVAVGKKHDIPATALRGTIQNDILKEYIARGTYIFPPRGSMRLITDVFAYCADDVPGWNTISISGYHIREAGADAVQELAFTFSDAIAYLDAAREAGQDIERIAGQLSFFFAANSALFEEVAKFRAARRVWERITRERYGVKDLGARTLRFHTQTMGSTLTAQQPLNNIVRTAIEALAAVLGGTQSLHTNAYDEALALPTEESARVALRTQQIIAEEAGVTESIDPLAGSYVVEKLTLDIEERVFAEIARIDEMGGALRGIERGYQQRAIEDSAYAQQRALEGKERIMVGVNAYTIDEEPKTPVMQHNEKLQHERVEKLKRVRDTRDAALAQRLRADIVTAAGGSQNLVPLILAAVEGSVTLGEICDDLRGVFGVYSPVTR